MLVVPAMPAVPRMCNVPPGGGVSAVVVMPGVGVIGRGSCRLLGGLVMMLMPVVRRRARGRGTGAGQIPRGTRQLRVPGVTRLDRRLLGRMVVEVRMPAILVVRGMRTARIAPVRHRGPRRIAGLARMGPPCRGIGGVMVAVVVPVRVPGHAPSGAAVWGDCAEDRNRVAGLSAAAAWT
jgi:hypothetical protein